MQDPNKNENFNMDDEVDSMLDIIKKRNIQNTNSVPSANNAQNTYAAPQPIQPEQKHPQQPQKTHVVDFDEIDPENAKKRRAKQRKINAKTGRTAAMGLIKTLVYVAAVIAISIFLATTLIKVANDIYAFEKDNVNVDIEIPQGATLDEVADILKENGIIKYPFVFKLYAEREFADSKYYNGEFKEGYIKIVFENQTDEEEAVSDGNYAEYIQLSRVEDEAKKPLNYDRIISLVAFSTYKPRETVRVTIPEGYTIDEIIDLLISNGVGEREEYIEAIQNYDYEYRFVKEIPEKAGRKYRLEGYLFPDTYDFFTDESEVSVINKLLSNFEAKFEDMYYERAAELGMSVDDLVTIASILQKEARYAEDLPIMSSVFHKRLGDNYRLESDATILYVIDDYETEELAAESPYNSYVTVGLIPGAISNPGIEAISAAFYPESTNYYYFFSLKNGETVYSRTFNEHNSKLNQAKAEGTYAS